MSIRPPMRQPLVERIHAQYQRRMAGLHQLIADLAMEALSEEGPDWTDEGIAKMRKRVANAVPQSMLPDYFADYRDDSVVTS